MLYTQITMGVADYSERQLKTIACPPFDLNRIQVATLTLQQHASQTALQHNAGYSHR